MRSRYLLILLIVIVSLLPAWFFNRYMQAVIQPRRSFAQLLLYMLVMAAFVAGYTFFSGVGDHADFPGYGEMSTWFNISSELNSFLGTNRPLMQLGLRMQIWIWFLSWKPAPG